MAERRQFQSELTPDPELQQLLEQAKTRKVTDEELTEQRISFAYGNAPASAHITKESVRASSRSLRLARSGG